MIQQNIPLASFCIASYNEEKYIEAALKGAISQDYPNLEIIVSDDCSTDNTYEIITEFFDNYEGNHKIILNRNNKNLGIAGNTNKMLYELSHGKYIILAGGDDISMLNRTSVSVDFMLKNPEVKSLSCDSKYIDEFGNDIKKCFIQQVSKGLHSIFTLADYINYPSFLIFSGDSRVLSREVVDSFPPLKYSGAEDIYFFIRSLYLGQIAFLRQPLVEYRIHSESVMAISRRKRVITQSEWKRYFRTSERQLFDDFFYAIEKGYFSDEYSKQVEDKIKLVANELRPRRSVFYRRILRGTLRFISRKCKELVYKI